MRAVGLAAPGTIRIALRVSRKAVCPEEPDSVTKTVSARTASGDDRVDRRAVVDREPLAARNLELP
jgi:hypothetical protein